MTLVRRLLLSIAPVMFLAPPSEAIAQRLESGPQVLTFYSDVDDTEQPYGLYLPPDYDATKAYPLVISLHGAGSNHRLNLRRVFGKSNAEGENDVEASRYFPAWEDVDYIVASPYARGTMGYQGVAEKDVMDVLADVKRRFSIDEDRVYLTGLSMGGGGTMWIGLTRPDLWAAIAPVCPAPPDGTADFAPNALHVPVRIFQGGADPVVQPLGTRRWVERFERLGSTIEYTEYPGVGHDSWVNAYADGQIFDWFDQFRRDPHPDRVRFVSDRYAYDTAYWVRLDALLPSRPAHIDATFTADNRLEVTTEGLDGFTLYLAGHPHVTGRRVALTIDGQRLEAPAADSVAFSRRDGVWTPAAYARTPGTKRPGLEGPMGEAVSSRHIYVYGTAGDPTEEALAVRRERAERAAEWSAYRGTFMGRVMVFPRVAPDREVRPSDLEDANLVLFGTPATNSVIARYSDQLPMHLNEAAAEEYGLVYVFPIGSNYALVNEGRPWWDTGEAGAGFFGTAVPALQLANRQDYLLFNAADGYTVSEGRFARDWRLPGRQAAQLRGSGVVVVHDDAIGAGDGVDLDALLAAMTLDEKLSFLYGARDPSDRGQAGYVPGVPRLGIPPLRLADGPAGIRTSLPATALPAPVALAASFDPDLARRFGQVIGREGRARHQDVLLSPMVNIVRVPEAGRNFETLGEDPLLAARMVAEEVRGIQGESLIATVKHYVANNYERDRTSTSAEVDGRTLSEIYLPGFEAAVDAGVGSIMCSYNRVNGVYACDSEELLTDILRDRFGFDGWVMTDWFARHSLGSLEAGLDQEMPGSAFPGMRGGFFADSLREAVVSGEIPEAAVDRAARRILGQMDRAGLLDGSAAVRPRMDWEAGRAVARDVAIAGTVLLKNEGGVLPIRAADLPSVVVIGPTARIPLIGGGGSSRVAPMRTVSLVDALQRRMGADATVRHVAGIDLDGVAVPTSALAPTGETGMYGLLRTAADGTTQVDGALDFTGDDALPAGSVRNWSGTITAPVTGEYELKLQTRGGSASLSLDGERLLSTGGFFGNASLLPTADGLENATATVRLEVGVPRSITVSTGGPRFPFMAGPGMEPLQIRLAWVTPQRRAAFVRDAVAAARSARTAIVIGYDEGTEGRDRSSLALPGTQDDLIDAVTRANRRTAVLVQTGSSVLMPWLDGAAAVAQVWYPGQEGGEATAAVLLGEANPGGRLPVTFPRVEADAPTWPPERYPGVDGRASYDEGVFVGYRWYDAQDIEPLFPFGHGLSYTAFEYDGLEVERAGDGVDVRFSVRNTGGVAGDEVAQVYLGPPSDPDVPMAPKRLVGFERITLEPGEQREVAVHIGARQLSYWSVEAAAWVRATGQRTVSVGASSRDIRLQVPIEIAGTSR
ncbi:MAG: prolyl oligopeptidase family serine peptidase [Gemmatimonadales bacterium]|nr:prolyl oligopeptidase family serine peptidase [Gemmatimonadales bacterium]